ncbi:MAG: hypothetical protein Q4B26_15935, partial [Eubacteriales bacterium]|nr:hypothetical protein [Eubacteriales bacterium]
MKKKMLSWLLAGTLALSGGQMAFAEELSDGYLVDSAYDAAATTEETVLPSDDAEAGNVVTSEDLSGDQDAATPENPSEDSSLLLPENDSLLIQENSDDVSSSETDGSEVSDAGDLLSSGEDSEEDNLEEGIAESVELNLNSSVAGDSSGTTVRQADFTEPL